MSAVTADIGVVIIGRNEGARLRDCLESLQSAGAPLVYVDSGSTDSSVELAKKHGASVIELDLSRPFTAARARNEGFSRLTSICPTIRYVQFLDGDCTIAANWMRTAADFLKSHPRHAVACGRRRERFPDASLFNQLCDLEWNTPIGDALACGGDAMMRVDAIGQVGGFNDAMIAGEEPELCVRLRQSDWKIRRLDADMTLHDAAMTRFSQWWRRNCRGGYAFALGASLHGKPPERHWIRETRSIVVWGIVLPLLSVALAWPTRGFSLLLFSCYPLLALKIFLRARRPDISTRLRFVASLFTVLGKFPEAIGVIRFWIDRVCATRAAIIEYKSGDSQVARV